MACSNVTCSSWPELQPNPDVSGIGVGASYHSIAASLIAEKVVISFFFSTSFTLALVAAQLLITPYSRPGENPLDHAVFNAIVSHRFRVKHQPLFTTCTEAIETGILAFSDTQLVTSLAILISGYLQLSCGISLFHWQMVVNLAWFSAITHLATLTSLRQYFRDHSYMAACRATVMGILLILLSIAFVPTGYLPQINIEGHNNHEHAYAHLVASPATCLLRPKSKTRMLDRMHVLAQESFEGDFVYPPYNTGVVVFSLTYLITSYSTRIIRISTPLSRFFGYWLEIRPMKYMEERYQKAKNGSQLQRLLLLIIIMAGASYEVGDSMIWEILWLSAALAWGVLRLVGLRIQTQLEDEDHWGFGQILPLLLSLLPIWCLLTTSHHLQHSTTTQHSQQSLSAVSAPNHNGPNGAGPSTFSNIKKTTWFRVLTILLVGSATVLAAYLLFDLPGSVLTLRNRNTAPAAFGRSGIDSLGFGTAFGWNFLRYLLALLFSSAILTLYVCTCLILCKQKSQSNMPRGRCRSKISHICNHRYFQSALFWWLLTFGMLGLEVAFIAVMLNILTLTPNLAGQGVPPERPLL